MERPAHRPRSGRRNALPRGHEGAGRGRKRLAGPDAESEARRAAHLQFGGATLWREIARDAWGWGVVRLVLRDAILMIAAGMAIGAPVAIAGARYIRSQLFGLRPADPLTLALACLALAAVALLAGYLPARRASRVNPVTALRYE